MNTNSTIIVFTANKRQLFSTQLPNAQVKRILIIRPCAIGDLIVTLPAIASLRRFYKNVHIEIMGYCSYLEIVKERFYADAISRFDQAIIASLFSENSKIPETLVTKLSSFDIVFSFVRDKNGIFTKNLKSAGVQCSIQYEPFPTQEKRIHMVDYFLKCLDQLDIPHETNVPELFFNCDDFCFARDFIKKKIVHPQKKFVVIHLGSGSRAKCWPLENFLSLIEWFSEMYGVNIVIPIGPAESELLEELKNMDNKSLILADNFLLPQLAAIIKQSELFIGNDSGITHLAAAAGANTLAIYGPTDPYIWGARGRNVRIIYKKIPCSPCFLIEQRDCFKLECMGNIHLNDVIHEIRNMANTYLL